MSDKYMIVKGQRGGKVLDLAMRMAEYIRSHPHEGAVIVVTQKGLDECVKDARKKVLDEISESFTEIYNSGSYCHETDCEDEGRTCEMCLWDAVVALLGTKREEEQKNAVNGEQK